MTVHDIDKATDDFGRVVVEITQRIAEDLDVEELFYEDFQNVNEWLMYYALK
jgi:hypothetical protein